MKFISSAFVFIKQQHNSIIIYSLCITESMFQAIQGHLQLKWK